MTSEVLRRHNKPLISPFGWSFDACTQTFYPTERPFTEINEDLPMYVRGYITYEDRDEPPVPLIHPDLVSFEDPQLHQRILKSLMVFDMDSKCDFFNADHDDNTHTTCKTAHTQKDMASTSGDTHSALHRFEFTWLTEDERLFEPQNTDSQMMDELQSLSTYVEPWPIFYPNTLTTDDDVSYL